MRSAAKSTDLTVCVCTRNSALTLEGCLESVVASEPGAHIMVIDKSSTDGSVEIAKRMGAEVHTENTGLGYARQLALELCRTEYLAFFDSDQEIVQPRFFRAAITVLQRPRVGAVVGMPVGHRFAYGLPMGMLVLRTRDFRGRVISASINAREEFFVRKRLEALGLARVFIPDVMVHRSQYRRYKPEWEGANTRIAAGISPRQLAFTFHVVLLQALNSGSIRNVAYVPVFYLKLLKGFADPGRWKTLPLEK